MSVAAERILSPVAKSSRFARLSLDPRTYCWLALFISLACLYLRLSSVPDLHDWINGDSLWSVNLFTDIFVDRYPLRGWSFSIAPFWFPDVFFAGVMYGLTRNVLAAEFLDAFAIFLSLILAICLCWRALRLPRARAAEVATLISAVALTLYVAFHLPAPYGAWHQFFIPQIHVGSLLNVVLALFFSLRLLQDPDGRARSWTVCLFLGLCALAAMSNILFLTHFMLPATIGIAFLVGFHYVPLRGTQAILAGWLASFGGLAMGRLLFTSAPVAAQSSIGWQSFRKALNVFIEGAANKLGAADFTHVLALVWLIACGVSLLWLTGVRRDRSKTPAGVLRIFFFVVAAGASIMSAATMIVGGSTSLTVLNLYGWTMHYMHPMFLLPLLTWPVFIGSLQASGKNVGSASLALLLPAMAAAVVAATLTIRTPLPAVPLHRYVPPLVRELDTYATLHGLKYGLAGYWQARLITLLSRTGLRAYQVDGHLQPFHWTNNIDWYTQSLENRNTEPPISFVVLDDPAAPMSRSDVTSIMGEPDEQATIAGVRVLVYSRSAARTALCESRASAFAGTASGPLDLAGGCLLGAVGHADQDTWKASQPVDTAGSVHVPSLPFPPGTYSIHIDYSATSSEDPTVAALNVDYGNANSLLSAALVAGASGFDGRFAVPPASVPARVHLRIFFQGFGTIEIRCLTIRRLG